MLVILKLLIEGVRMKSNGWGFTRMGHDADGLPIGYGKGEEASVAWPP